MKTSNGMTFKYEHYFPEVPIDPDYANNFKEHCVTDEETAFRLFDALEGHDFAWDTETKGLNFDEEEFIVGFSIARDPKGGSGYYFPLRHKTGKNLPWSVFEKFDELLSKSRNYAYNAPFDIMTMIVSGSKHWRNYKTLDVLVMTYLMDPAWSRDGMEYMLDSNGNKILQTVEVENFGKKEYVQEYKMYTPGNGLKWCEKHYLGHIVPTFEETLGIKGDSVTFADLDPKDGAKYASIDAAGTYQLARLLIPILHKECPFILQLDLKLANLFSRILMNKVHFNKAEMRRMYLTSRLEWESITRGIFSSVGYPFSVSSKIELSDALSMLGVNTGKRNKDGTMSTSKDLLVGLKTDIMVKTQEEEYPLNQALIKVASIPKQMDYMKKLMVSGWGRFNYNMCSMVTGRFSSGVGKKGSDYFVPLNYQNLTKPTPAMFKYEETDEPGNILGYKFTMLSHEEVEERTKNGLPVVEGQSPNKNIRRAISVPDDSWIFVSRDYCQEELVYGAAISGEPVWGDAIKAGMDLHENTAKKMFPDREYNKHLRKLCKACNFSLLYGASPKVFAETAQIDLDLAEELYNRFWSTMRVLDNYRERMWRQCLENGGVLHTRMGRPRRLGSLIQSGDKKLIRDAKKAILSHLIQGGCADVMRINLVEIFKNGGLADKFNDSFRFVGMIHDETNVMMKKDRFYDIVFEHQKIMEQTVPGTDFVLKTSVEFGNSYGESFPFVFDEVKGKFIPKV